MRFGFERSNYPCKAINAMLCLFQRKRPGIKRMHGMLSRIKTRRSKGFSYLAGASPQFEKIYDFCRLTCLRCSALLFFTSLPQLTNTCLPCCNTIETWARDEYFVVHIGWTGVSKKIMSVLHHDVSWKDLMPPPPRSFIGWSQECTQDPTTDAWSLISQRKRKDKENNGSKHD